ncbi:Alpha/Beta hydrolase protein [Phaeosphaeriaceae sp. PMI808]|nr:Alpha/Beta hydrolase protein [Phaeosphaeriaceae sp. PMI808]
MSEFLGIRYAEVPIGELRFAAPKAYVASNGVVFEASQWNKDNNTDKSFHSDDCPSNKPPVNGFPNFTQPAGLRVWKNFAAQNNNSASEDCLKLSIWTRNPGNSSAKKPVIVFLHGEQDAVVVTPNYRLGIFGFPGAPGSELNAALRDHRAAVEWVRENIAAFGGDPSHIVLTGQSAGDYKQLSASGAFARIPLVAGYGDHEDGWYRLSGYAARINLTNVQWDLFSGCAFVCSTSYSTKHRVQHGVPTWRYRYHGDWDNLRLYNSTTGLGPKGSDAYHGSDLNMVFDTSEDVSDLEDTPDENATKGYMMGAWAAFARDAKDGLTKYGWPEYNPNGTTIVQLAYNNSAVPVLANSISTYQNCSIKNDPLPGRGAF